MGRTTEGPWYRRSTGCYMCTLAGKQFKLLKAEENPKNKKLAGQKYHQLMLTTVEAPDSPNADVVSLCDAYIDWAEQNLKPRTYKGHQWYLQGLIDTCGRRHLSELKTIHITEWLGTKKTWGKTTLYNARRIVKRVLNWGVEQQILAKNPLAGMKLGRPESRAEFMSDTTYLKVRRAANPELRCLLYALKRTGARPSELYQLRWEQVRPDSFFIREHKTQGTTLRPRTIYLCKHMTRLIELLQPRRSNSEHVFVDPAGRPWNGNKVQKRLNQLRTELQITERVYVYALRHAFAAHALSEGHNTATVAELMGHADTTMVSRVYGHLREQREHLSKSINEINRRRGPRRSA